jgi:hypothetical protein
MPEGLDDEEPDPNWIGTDLESANAGHRAGWPLATCQSEPGRNQRAERDHVYPYKGAGGRPKRDGFSGGVLGESLRAEVGASRETRRGSVEIGQSGGARGKTRLRHRLGPRLSGGVSGPLIMGG